MTQRTFNTAAGIIFTLVTVLHALRLLLGWDAVIGGWVVPGWFSVLGLFIAGLLAYSAFTFNRK